MFTSNMAVFVRFLHRRFSTIVTYIIIGFLFLSQLLLGTIFHMTNNVTFEFGVRRASRCYKWYIFSSLSNKGCLHLSFATLWLNRFSCPSLLPLSVMFLLHIFSRQVNTLPLLTVAMFETKAILSQKVTLHNPVFRTTDVFFL